MSLLAPALYAAAVARDDLMLFQMVSRLAPIPPVPVMAVIITTEINPAMIPYSIAVAPSSSRRKRAIELSMIYPFKVVLTKACSVDVIQRNSVYQQEKPVEMRSLVC